ncbi:hypothetical protein SAMN05216566_14410 [Aureimonas phyllosphaerae]|uniref:Uncharacterized protein n=1 Tax=Aureimonas phyllosphaerae TaxID=1166078 RepID=A0A7W6BUG7_9HYPH|nr:hypothetical protein [Aureimonas phyllosphaerae]MBB3962250.1 hypothetical protein [Aureimonas phyllosphaerae]SFF59762.1 hypothetical protein SAMN05216566_14410 [Aureimonas phyllosphaerae]
MRLILSALLACFFATSSAAEAIEGRATVVNDDG